MDTKERISIMNAFLEGKDIKYVSKYNGSSCTLNIKTSPDILWNWEEYNYFIVQPPRRFWIIDYGCMNRYNPWSAEKAFTSYREAKSNCCDGGVIIEVVEVLK